MNDAQRRVVMWAAWVLGGLLLAITPILFDEIRGRDMIWRLLAVPFVGVVLVFVGFYVRAGGKPN